MALIRFPHSGQEERFEFTPENRAELERIIAKYPVKRSALIPALQLAQEQEGFITSAVMQHVAEIFEVSPMEVWGVVSFYTMLKTQPIGEYHVQVCNNLSCALMGAGRLLREIENRLDCRDRPHARGREILDRGGRMPGRVRGRSLRAGERKLFRVRHARDHERYIQRAGKGRDRIAHRGGRGGIARTGGRRRSRRRRPGLRILRWRWYWKKS